MSLDLVVTIVVIAIGFYLGLKIVKGKRKEVDKCIEEGYVRKSWCESAYTAFVFMFFLGWTGGFYFLARFLITKDYDFLIGVGMFFFFSLFSLGWYLSNRIIVRLFITALFPPPKDKKKKKRIRKSSKEPDE